VSVDAYDLRIEAAPHAGSNEGEGDNVIAYFNWVGTATFEEVVSGNEPTLTSGASLETSDPHDHTNDGQRALRTTAGGSYMYIESGTEISAALDAVTLSVDVRRSSAPQSTQYLVYRPNGFGFAFNSNGTLSWYVYTSGSWKAVTSSFNVAATNQWVNLRGVWDGEYSYLFVDGTLRGRTAVTGSTSSYTGDWAVSGIGTQGATIGDVTNVWATSDAQFPKRRPTDLARWDFDEGDGSSIPSTVWWPTEVSPEDAAVQGSPDYVEQQYPGRGMTFDSSGDYLLVDGTVTERARGLTLSAWLRREGSLGNPTDVSIVVAKPYSYNLQFYGDNRLECWVRDALGSWHSASSGSVTLPLDEWRHAGCTFDGDTVGIYIDGRLIDSASGGEGMYATDDDFYIGYAAYELFPGTIVDPHVISEATTGAGIVDSIIQYDWTDTGQSQTLTNVVGDGGDATIANLSWTTGLPDARQSALDVSNGYITIDGDALAGPDELAFAMWVQLLDTPSQEATIASRSDDFTLTVRSDMVATWTVKATEPGGSTATSYQVTSGVNTVKEDEWHHLAGRWRAIGDGWSVDLYFDGHRVGTKAVPGHMRRDVANTASVCVGQCGGGVDTYVTALAFGDNVAHPFLGIDPEVPDEPSFTCGATGGGTTVSYHREYVGEDCPDDDCSGSGVSYWYAKNSSGTACKGPHPIVLVQGLGQYAESWSICSEPQPGISTETGVLDLDDPLQKRWASLAASPSGCDSDYTEAATDMWCPTGDDVVGTLLKYGYDVITIDFDKAMADYNELPANQLLPYTRDCGEEPCGSDWMIPGGDETDPPGSGNPIAFEDYWNPARYVKCELDPVETAPREYGRHGRPLENAWALSLIIEYLLDDEDSPTEGRKPIVIGHSMGGLVANLATVSRSWSALDLNMSTGLYDPADDPEDGTWLGRDAHDDIEAVITLGAPHEGSGVVDLAIVVKDESEFGDFANGHANADDLINPLGGEGSMKLAVYKALHLGANVGAGRPANAVLSNAVWHDSGDWRDRIDDRFGEVLLPEHYLIAGTNATERKFPDEEEDCYHIPTEEVIKRDGLGLVIDMATPYSTDIFFQRQTSDADNFKLVCGPPNWYPDDCVCKAKKSQRYYCKGNQDIPVGWRQISQQRGDVELPAWPCEWPFCFGGLYKFTPSQILDGYHNFDYRGWGDDTAFSWTITDAPTEYGFDAQSRNDGLIRAEEALANSSMTYATRLDGADVYSESCEETEPDPYEPRRTGELALNHHQLRTSAVLFSPICHPDSTTTCEPVLFLKWLGSL
jgi:hypothetical protein